jgi:hypothetical protein
MDLAEQLALRTVATNAVLLRIANPWSTRHSRVAPHPVRQTGAKPSANALLFVTTPGRYRRRIPGYVLGFPAPPRCRCP